MNFSTCRWPRTSSEGKIPRAKDTWYGWYVEQVQSKALSVNILYPKLRPSVLLPMLGYLRGLIGLVVALVDLHRVRRQAAKADGRPPTPAL